MEAGSAQCLSYIIGGTFIIVAFGIVIAAFPVGKAYTEKLETWEPQLLPVLYSISIVQLIINVALFYVSNSTLLFSITGIFLIVVLAALICMIKKRKVLNDIAPLMLATLVFNVLSIVLIFIEVNRWQVAPYLGIGIVLLIRTILIYEKVEKQRGEQ